MLIDVLGADHHGYLQRMRAGDRGARARPSALEALLMQLVQVVERGERAQMSKRRGEFVTLDELVDDIGIDAARFFMLQRSHDTAIDLDLELARGLERQPRLLRPVRARADREHPAQGGRGGGRHRAAEWTAASSARGAVGAGPDQAAARAARRGGRDGGAPGAAPPLRLLDDDRRRLPRLLSRLQGRRRRGRGRPGIAPGALPC